MSFNQLQDLDQDYIDEIINSLNDLLLYAVKHHDYGNAVTLSSVLYAIESEAENKAVHP